MNYLDLYKDYLVFERSLSDKTVESYLTEAKKFSDFLKENNINEENCKASDIRKFIEIGKNNNEKDATIMHKISVLRSYYRFLNNDKITKNNPMITIEFIKPEKKLPVYLSLEEVNKILQI